jgi:hypothetical protein
MRCMGWTGVSTEIQCCGATFLDCFSYRSGCHFVNVLRVDQDISLSAAFSCSALRFPNSGPYALAVTRLLSRYDKLNAASCAFDGEPESLLFRVLISS